MMSNIIVYTMENCPNPDPLKATLKELGIDFKEQDLETKEAIIELRFFSVEGPVLNQRIFLARMGR